MLQYMMCQAGRHCERMALCGCGSDYIRWLMHGCVCVWQKLCLAISAQVPATTCVPLLRVPGVYCRMDYVWQAAWDDLHTGMASLVSTYTGVISSMTDQKRTLHIVLTIIGVRDPRHYGRGGLTVVRCSRSKRGRLPAWQCTLQHNGRMQPTSGLGQQFWHT